MKEVKPMSRRDRIREMTITAMFIAIIAVMAFTPIGFITIFAVAATLIHIPVLIGGAVLGRRTGIILGLAFGVVSLIRGATSADLNFVFVFPWVSILPRFIFGLLIYDVYQLTLKLVKKRILALVISFFVLSMLHSIMVLPLMVSAFPIIVNSSTLSLKVGDALAFISETNTLSIAMKVIWGVLISNSILEAVLAATVGAIVADRLIQYLKFNQSYTVSE